MSNHLKLQSISKKQRWVLGFLSAFVITLSFSVTDALKSLIKTSLLELDAGDAIYFPSAEQIIDNQGEFAFNEITFLLIGIFLFLFLIPIVLLFFRNKKGLIVLLPTTAIGCGFIFIGGTQSAQTYQEISKDLKYRIPVDEIAQIKVTRLDDENETCSSLRLNDREIITNGFEKLTQAQSKRLSHEGFAVENGYSIALSFINTDEHYPYLIVHRESTNKRPAEAVVLQFSSRGEYGAKGYSSPEFFGWLAEYVDPNFENCVP